MARTLQVITETWWIDGGFAIARGVKSEAVIVLATISDGQHAGRGEAVPYARYGETIDRVVAAMRAMADPIARGIGRHELRRTMPPGAARSALDAALWDLEAKTSGRDAADIAGLPQLRALETAFTLSLGTAAAMAAAATATAAAGRSLLKLKLGGPGDPERIAAVRRAAPAARLIVDANESWSPADYEANIAACLVAGVELVEQPFPADADRLLIELPHPLPICADESAHIGEDLARLAGRYDAVNIKLDKAGGLTEALDMAAAAKAMGFKLMVGCMVGTSLAMAPAMLAAQSADFVDLDGPLILARDRVPGLRYDGSIVHPPHRELWG